MIYCDTSLLIAALTTEVLSDRAQPWLLEQERRSLAISDWSLTEFASAVAMKHRRGEIDTAYRGNIEHAWGSLRTEFTFVRVTDRHFLHAAELVDAAPRGLRSGDALHLAIVLDQGCALATFDHDLADAARALGVAVHPA